MGLNLFGSGAGWDGSYKGDVNQTLGDYMAMGDQLFGPNAYDRQIGQYQNNLSDNLAVGNAAGQGNLQSRGVRPSGNNLFAVSSARNLAGEQSNLQQQLAQGRLNWIQGRGQMLNMFAPVFHHDAKPGLFQTLGSLAGQVIGASSGIPNLGQADPAGLPTTPLLGQHPMTYGGSWGGGGTPSPPSPLGGYGSPPPPIQLGNYGSTPQPFQLGNYGMTYGG